MKSSRVLRIGVAVVCLLLAAFTAFMIVSPYKGVVVITDSMRPAIPKWSFVIVSPANAERTVVGDIVLFTDPEQATSVLHRVVSIDAQARLMMTKGDTNKQADLYPVSWSLLQGRYAAHVPAVGWLVYYARQYALLLAFALLTGLLVSLAVAYAARGKERP